MASADKVPMLPEGHRKLNDELRRLRVEERPEIVEAIEAARAHGDLSENAEYHMAKQRQEFVKARFRQLGKRLADLSLTNMNNIPKDKVGLGSTVKVYDSTKDEEWNTSSSPAKNPTSLPAKSRLHLQSAMRS